jgi:hypothetical protein
LPPGAPGSEGYRGKTRTVPLPAFDEHASQFHRNAMTAGLRTWERQGTAFCDVNVIRDRVSPDEDARAGDLPSDQALTTMA